MPASISHSYNDMACTCIHTCMYTHPCSNEGIQRSLILNTLSTQQLLWRHKQKRASNKQAPMKVEGKGMERIHKQNLLASHQSPCGMSSKTDVFFVFLFVVVACLCITDTVIWPIAGQLTGEKCRGRGEQTTEPKK